MSLGSGQPRQVQVLTTGQTVAVSGGHPQVGGAGVKDDGETLGGRANADLPVVLGLVGRHRLSAQSSAGTRGPRLTPLAELGWEGASLAVQAQHLGLVPTAAPSCLSHSQRDWAKYV